MRHLFAFAFAALAIAGCTNEVGITCPPGQTLCGTTCIYTTIDPKNCGSCANACSAETVCINGMCGCPTGQTICDGKCVDTKSDVNHCGMCATACPAPQVCSLSACADSCAAGLTDCDHGCVDLTVDDRNCGSCGNLCGTGDKCMAGACAPECPPGQMLCSGTCVNTTNDGSHCGVCGNDCPANHFCVLGICILGCPQPLTRCLAGGGPSDGGTLCVDTLHDPNNCGGCGGDAPPAHVCEVSAGRHTDPVCNNGICAASCETGFVDCRATFNPQALPPAPAGASELACYDFLNDPCNCASCFNGSFTPVRGWFGNIDNTGLIVCELNDVQFTQALCCNGMPTDLDGFGSTGFCGSSCANAAPCPSTAPDCCPTGASVSEHVCKNLSNDLNNCGGCGVFSAANDCTTLGFAVPACCGGGCQDLTLPSSGNCGACGNDCTLTGATTPACCAGVRPSPSPGPGCIDLDDDPTNCGGCGNDCQQICGASTCTSGNCNCP